MIMSDKHQKHPPLARIPRGTFHPVEWVIYGTTCGGINSLVDKIKQELTDLRLFYVDADHSEENHAYYKRLGSQMIHHDRYDYWNEYDSFINSRMADAVLVNGNHYPATRQIVVIDPMKESSLQRRHDQLTDIPAVIVKEDESEIYPWLQDSISATTVIFKEKEINRLTGWLHDSVKDSIAPVSALILAGGKSTRMGEDKSQIKYHRKTMELHLAEVCRELNVESFISKQHSYPEDNIQGIPVIKDRMPGMGPFGAIISAFIEKPDSAWMVMACDMPQLDKASLQELLTNRMSSKSATAVKGKDKPFPEPLLAIYEPRIYPRMLDFLALGYACPRKVLINSEVETITLISDDPIMNVNTPEERQQYLENKEANGQA